MGVDAKQESSIKASRKGVRTVTSEQEAAAARESQLGERMQTLGTEQQFTSPSEAEIAGSTAFSEDANKKGLTRSDLMGKRLARLQRRQERGAGLPGAVGYQLGRRINRLEGRIAGRQASITQLNDLGSQIEQALKAGDDQLVLDLSKQRDEMAGGIRGVSLKTPAEMEAREAMGSPTAQTVGKLVQDANQLLTDEGRERFLGRITDPYNEAIDEGERRQQRDLAGEYRSAQRSMRDFGLARGSARSANDMAAIAGRVGERFGTASAQIRSQAAAQKAQVMGEAAKQYEGFSRQWSADVAKFAQAWVQNSEGVRDSYGQSMIALAGMRSDAFQALSGTLIQNAQLDLQQQQAKNQMIMGGIGAAAGLISSIPFPSTGTDTGATG